MITLAGIQLMTSRGKEEKMKEAKNKILYTILALIFVGIIEAWKRLAFGGVIDDGVNLFESLVNLSLFFAVPVAIFFLVLASYYLITSNGDEERVKKAKSIIINTLLATLILLAGYTFLLDLASF
jgi:heme/copper-type cytochrome/quinol oxidase subunit 3